MSRVRSCARPMDERREDIPWAARHARVSYRFEYAVLRLCQVMTQKAASELLHMSASTLSDQLHRSIERYRHGHRVRGVRVIGIDEVSYHKRHKYATLVYDLERSVVVWVGRAWPRYHRPVLRSPAQRLPEVTDPHRVLRHERSVHGRDHDSLPQCSSGPRPVPCCQGAQRRH